MEIATHLIHGKIQWAPNAGLDSYQGKPIVFSFQDTEGDMKDCLGIEEGKIVRSSCQRGANLSIPLQFSEHDSIFYSMQGSMEAVTFSPWDLPFLSTGRGILKVFSQLDFFADSANFPESATPQHARISSDRSVLYVPAGWFFQIRVLPKVQNERCLPQLGVIELDRNKQANLRPTLMYLRGTSEMYSDIIRRKRAKIESSSQELKPTLHPCVFSECIHSIQQLPSFSDEANEFGACGWPCRGTALELELTDDWFSRNLRHWVPIFGRLGWFCTFDCCRQHAALDAVNPAGSAQNSGRGPERQTGQAPRSPVPLHALELGSWEGSSACWLLAHVLRHPSSRLTCIDTFRGGREHQSRPDLHLIESRPVPTRATCAGRAGDAAAPFARRPAFCWFFFRRTHRRRLVNSHISL